MAEMEKHDSPGSESPSRIENISASEKQMHSTFVVPTASEEAAVIRKLDYRLLPLVFVLYSLAVLDRSNLGNARLAGMTKDINLEGNRYNLLGTIFYIAYICSQWLCMGWKQFSPHKWCAFCVFFWGFIATIQATAFSWGGLMACRFFLGIAEACFGPGVPLYLSYFYPRDKIGFRHGVFISGAAMANAYGGALAYGISQIKGSVAPWRILFIIEGAPTCLFAIVVWFYLPDSILKAPFLTDREKDIALHMTARNQRIDVDKQTGVRLKEMLMGMKGSCWRSHQQLPNADDKTQTLPRGAAHYAILAAMFPSPLFPSSCQRSSRRWALSQRFSPKASLLRHTSSASSRSLRSVISPIAFRCEVLSAL
ncbi:hypothetical protein LTR95_018673 [Oleoguttula sp. CCFEE 5521]